MKYAICFFVLLAGCATTKVPEVVTIETPVSVKCAVAPAKPQLHTDAEIKAMDDYRATIALFSDRLKQSNYILDLEAALSGCL